MKKLAQKFTTLILCLALLLPLLACNNPAQTPETPDTSEDNKVATTYVGIDINPSVELTLDKDGVVCTVYGANDDGTILLYGEVENIVGKNYEAAVEHITNLAVELDYITEGHEIIATVTSDNAQAAEEVKAKIDAKIVAAADSLGFHVRMSGEVAREVLHELEELKEKYKDNVNIQNLTPGKYKLVLAATEDGELTIDAAVQMNTDELIGRVNDAHKKVEAFATDLYKEAKVRAEKLYESAMGIALDGIYTTVYLKRVGQIFAHPEYRDTFYYGAVYQAYKTSARTLDSLSDILEFGQEMANYELSEETVMALCAELEIEDASVLADENGKVTLGSVSKFTRNFLRQNDIAEEVQDRVEELIDEAEDAAEMAALASDAYAEDLAALKSQIEQIVATIETTAKPFLTFMSEEGKTAFEGTIADLKNTASNIALMMEGGLSEDELEVLIENAEEKADEMLEKIEGDLTEEEKAEVEELKEKAKQTIDNLTEQFTSRLGEAEKQAKAEIERRREERKNKSPKGH